MILSGSDLAFHASMLWRVVSLSPRASAVGSRAIWQAIDCRLAIVLWLVVSVGPELAGGMHRQAGAQPPDDQRQQVFQSWLGIGPNQPQNRERLQEKGERWIDLVDEICGLLPDQRDKLMLALSADLQGLERSIESARLRFYELVPSDRDVTTVWNDRELNQQLSSIISAVHQQRTNLLTDSSLLVAAQSAILDPDQQQRWKTFRQQRQRHLHDLFVRQWIVALEHEFPLATRHREAFYQTLLEITQPPDVQETQFFSYLQRQLWQIDIERLAEHFSPTEQTRIKQTLVWTQQQLDRQARGNLNPEAADVQIRVIDRGARVELRAGNLQGVRLPGKAEAEAADKQPPAQDAKR
jgi:hypothetical protein